MFGNQWRIARTINRPRTLSSQKVSSEGPTLHLTQNFAHFQFLIAYACHTHSMSFFKQKLETFKLKLEVEHLKFKFKFY